MKPLQQVKIAPTILPAAAVLGGSATSVAVDTAGAGYAEIHVQLGASDTALTVLKIQEADTISGSSLVSPTDVVAAAALPGASDDNKTWVFGVDLRKPRKRYLAVVATVGAGGQGATGAFIAATALLSQQLIGSSVASDRNVAEATYV